MNKKKFSDLLLLSEKMGQRLKDLKAAFNVEKEKIKKCIEQAFKTGEIDGENEDVVLAMDCEEYRHLRCQFCLRMFLKSRCHYEHCKLIIPIWNEIKQIEKEMRRKALKRKNQGWRRRRKRSS